MRKLLKLIVPGLVFAITVASRGAEEESGRAPELWTPKVQAILSISGRDAKVGMALARVLEDLRTDPKRAEASVAQLVDALNQGHDVSALIAELRAHNTIADEAGMRSTPKDARYGTALDRIELLGYLNAREKAIRQQDPATAAKYARASLLLMMQEIDANGPLLEPAPKEFRTAERAKLDPDQADRLYALVDEAKAEMKRESASRVSFRNILFQIARTTRGNIPAELLDQALGAARRSRAAIRTVPGQLRLAHDVWLLLNIARASNDLESIEKLTAFFEQWKDQSKGTPMEKWLTEALERTAPPIEIR